MSEPLATKAEYQSALARVREAAETYYDSTGTDLVMSDAQYDQLLSSIADTEDLHPEWVKGKAAGASVAAGAKLSGDVKHSRPMLSLDNVYSADELAAWLKRVVYEAPGSKFMVEPKFDGLALNLIYIEGELVQVVTRGDGITGEGVSYCIPNIDNVPTTGACWADGKPFSGSLRGEAIFTHEQFETANERRAENGDKPFVNARNGVAGAVRGSKDRDYKLPFRFICYDYADLSGTPLMEGVDYFDIMGAIGRAGFSVSTRHSNVLTASEVPAAVEKWEQARHQANVDTDGAVIKVISPRDRAKLGMSSRAPRWAIAYKFPAEEAMSTLDEVIWQVGRTGVITPRARIAPVFVAGTTITYATLHNVSDIERKGFLLHDTVLVKRAGEVIPRIEAPVVGRRDGSQTPIEVPTVCPRCGGDIDKSQERWRCERGRLCGLKESIRYAVSRDALDVEGMGSFIVDSLVASGRVQDLSDLFTLTADEIANVQRRNSDGSPKFNDDGAPSLVGPTVAQKVHAEIVKAKSAPLARIITALGIRGTGRSLSRTLAREFGSMQALEGADITRLAEVEKIGQIKAGLIVDELAELADVIERMYALGIAMADEEDETGAADGTADAGSKPLAGMTVVVTGSMKGALAGLSRNEVNELIEKMGGKSSGSVSKTTSLLVVGENAGSKLAKATDLGVAVKTEAEFAAMIGR